MSFQPIFYQFFSKRFIKQVVNGHHDIPFCSIYGKALFHISYHNLIIMKIIIHHGVTAYRKNFFFIIVVTPSLPPLIPSFCFVHLFNHQLWYCFSIWFFLIPFLNSRLIRFSELVFRSMLDF